jgi:hypothetical protein
LGAERIHLGVQRYTTLTRSSFFCFKIVTIDRMSETQTNDRNIMVNTVVGESGNGYKGTYKQKKMRILILCQMQRKKPWNLPKKPLTLSS